MVLSNIIKLFLCTCPVTLFTLTYSQNQTKIPDIFSILLPMTWFPAPLCRTSPRHCTWLPNLNIKHDLYVYNLWFFVHECSRSCQRHRVPAECFRSKKQAESLHFWWIQLRRPSNGNVSVFQMHLTERREETFHWTVCGNDRNQSYEWRTNKERYSL